MKRLISISLVLLMLTSLIYGGENVSIEDIKPNVFAGVIRDTSPTSEKNWNMQHAVNVEIVHSLKSGDWLTEWVARPGRPSVPIDTIVTTDGPEKYHIINKISGTSKEWLFSADIARAMEAAFDSFREKDKDYQCCLIIITKGQMSNKQVAQIRRYAGAFKARGWAVCITCDKKHANRKLLVAANNKELDIRFIDKASLSDWIDNVRSASVYKSSKGTATRKAKPELEVHDKQPIKTKDGRSMPLVIPTEGAKQPIEVKIVELPGEKGFDDVNMPDSGKYPSEITKKDHRPIDKEISTANGTKDGQKRKSSIIKTVLAIIFLIGVLGAMFLIVFSYSKSTTGPRAFDQTDDNIQYRLIAFLANQKYDMGPLDALGEITIGNGIGSTIFIDEETIEDKHVRIFKSRKGLKIQNLADSPIIVNGLELTHRRKTILNLPVDIELTNDVTVTVLSEPVEMNKEFNSDENENI